MCSLIMSLFRTEEANNLVAPYGVQRLISQMTHQLNSRDMKILWVATQQVSSTEKLSST